MQSFVNVKAAGTYKYYCDLKSQYFLNKTYVNLLHVQITFCYENTFLGSHETNS
jgi:hypothetical protein